MKKYIITITAIALIVIALGCSGSNNNNAVNTSKSETTTPAAQPTTTEQTEQPALEVLSSKLVKEEYGGYSITGTAKANKDLSYAEVSAKCYGPDGAVVGSYLTNMNNLKSGETWNFKVIGPMDNSVRVTNYTISNGNSF